MGYKTPNSGNVKIGDFAIGVDESGNLQIGRIRRIKSQSIRLWKEKRGGDPGIPYFSPKVYYSNLVVFKANTLLVGSSVKNHMVPEGLIKLLR